MNHRISACADRIENAFMIFLTEDETVIQIPTDSRTEHLSEGDWVHLVIDDTGAVVSIQSDTEKTEKRRAEISKKQRRLFQ